MNYDELLTMYREALKDHVLTQELDTVQYKAFRMGRPRSSTYMVRLIFSPVGIILAGDVRFGNAHGIVSRESLGLDWFREQMESHYLASKFLTTFWELDACAKGLDEIAEQYTEEAGELDEAGTKRKEELARIASGLSDIATKLRTDPEEWDACSVYDAVQKLYDVFDLPGSTYDYGERAMLTAVHERFVQLYAEMVDKKAIANQH